MQGTVASLSSRGHLPAGESAAVPGTNSLRPGPRGEKPWPPASSREKPRSSWSAVCCRQKGSRVCTPKKSLRNIILNGLFLRLKDLVGTGFPTSAEKSLDRRPGPERRCRHRNSYFDMD